MASQNIEKKNETLTGNDFTPFGGLVKPVETVVTAKPVESIIPIKLNNYQTLPANNFISFGQGGYIAAGNKKFYHVNTKEELEQFQKLDNNNK